VLEATDGAEAMALYARGHERIHAIICDCVLPDIQGPALMNRLAHAWPEARVVMVSGHPREHIEARGGIGAAADFLQKPFTVDDLLKRLQHLLSESRRMQASG
jgi:DNA-binding response OmpR family regulator